MKPGKNWSSGFRKEDVKKLHDFIYVCSPRSRAENPQGTKFD